MRQPKLHALLRAMVARHTGDGCLEWTRRRTLDGYGKLVIDGRERSAHRLAYEAANGLIPAGLCILHKCDNPPCINPNHLFAGTPADNALDKERKGRQCKGEQSPNAKLTTDAVRLIRQAWQAGAKMRDLAVQYGVSTSAIHRAITGRKWAHVTEAAQ